MLAYDQAGADRGNALKTTKEPASYDHDARAVLDYLKSHPSCTGKLGVMGICIGGHLAFRAAMNPGVLAGVCYPELALKCQGLALELFKRKLGEGDLPGQESSGAAESRH